MMQVYSRFLTAFTIAAALAVSPLVAGTDYEIEVTDHKRDRVEVTNLQVEGSNLRMGRAAQGRRDAGGSLLFQGDRREGKEPRVIIEDGQGGHMVLNQEKMDQLAKAIPPGAAAAMNPEMVETARAQAERIADPQARARALEQLDQRFGSTGNDQKPSLEYVERGVRDKHGYPCVRYDVMRDGQKIAEVWATDWANLEGGRGASKAFAEFEQFYTGLMDRFAEASGMSAEIFRGHESSFHRIFELNRFPVAVYEYEGSEVVRSSVLKSAQKVEHEPSVFKIDPGSVEREFGSR